jgi:hypothetical protein
MGAGAYNELIRATAMGHETVTTIIVERHFAKARGGQWALRAVIGGRIDGRSQHRLKKRFLARTKQNTDRMEGTMRKSSRHIPCAVHLE